MKPSRRLARLLVGSAGLASPALAEPLRLQFPLACDPGRTCFIQYYVDRDPGAGIRDYTCGSRAYEGHDGTDIRLPSRAAETGPLGVVRAAAAGTILRARNDAPDVSVRETGLAQVAGVECGNGLVIAHPGGYETQYCHLAKGSITLRPGTPVAAGQPIGRAGLSGATEFPHLHFTIRRDGRTIDPFAPEAEACAPGGPGLAASLWDPSLHEGLRYRAGTILDAGFADGAVTLPAIEAEATRPPGADPGALVAWARAIGLDAGDTQSLVLTGPDGRVLAEAAEPALVRPRAQSLVFGGRKRPGGGWPPGTYKATFRVIRGGAVALERRFALDLPAGRP
ncbi:M23 family metallopeptidase [Methylobacterium planeticum]|uniref:M23 family metallopeptidase n=1 Tax=Methylobacterium planeticum TaxID=2615211 RepID=A0A6N6MZM3_9HYPH|nr:M23 family metallopeptidase [Methylobacterium planeticum]KAB1076064.1 M23 family metallopeptidase [Methylobacterium planeticum]